MLFRATLGLFGKVVLGVAAMSVLGGLSPLVFALLWFAFPYAVG